MLYDVKHILIRYAQKPGGPWFSLGAVLAQMSSDHKIISYKDPFAKTFYTKGENNFKLAI